MKKYQLIHNLDVISFLEQGKYKQRKCERPFIAVKPTVGQEASKRRVTKT